MNNLVGSFAVVDLSPLDESKGNLLTYLNLAVIQNLKAAAAEESLVIAKSFIEPKLAAEDFINSRLRAAYLAGQIDMANTIQQRHEATQEESQMQLLQESN